MPDNNSVMAVAVANFTVALMNMDSAKKQAEAALAVINPMIMSSLTLKDAKGWLTDAGKATLKQYWESDVPVQKAADLMEISYSAVRTYFMRWNEEWNAANT